MEIEASYSAILHTYPDEDRCFGIAFVLMERKEYYGIQVIQRHNNVSSQVRPGPVPQCRALGNWMHVPASHWKKSNQEGLQWAPITIVEADFHLEVR